MPTVLLTIHKVDLDVADGFFTTELDFGEASYIFGGDKHLLEISIRPGEYHWTDPNGYSTLSPRQEITPTPYAINADKLDGLHYTSFAISVHSHDGSDINSGTVSEGYIDADITRDTELTSGLGTKADVVHSHDGADINSGQVDESYIDPDMATDSELSSGLVTKSDISHNHDPSYSPISHDHDPNYVNVTGDTMTGTLTLPGNGLVVGTNQLVTSGGNVGIGDSSPAAKLTVNGAILRSGSTMYGAMAHTHINLGTDSITGESGMNYWGATVSGGNNNTASGSTATVGGGWSNCASEQDATVSGGQANGLGATIGGGWDNTAKGAYATVSGGYNNTADGNCSFAAGRRAKANHGSTFVWADNFNADFASTGFNQFLIRAYGGVGINIASPARSLHVNDVMRLEPRASAPSSPSAGDIYFDSTDNMLKCYNGLTWKDCW